GKGKNYGSWQPRRKPHWASWKPRDFSGSAKGTGKGKFDKWGGEYCVGGYKDLAGNFYECGQGRTRKRTPGKGSQERQAAGKAKGKAAQQQDWSLCMHAVRDLAVVARR
ncbi:unnamed protein product, partial [Durusdinium trenchii]